MYRKNDFLNTAVEKKVMEGGGEKSRPVPGLTRNGVPVLLIFVTLLSSVFLKNGRILQFRTYILQEFPVRHILRLLQDGK